MTMTLTIERPATTQQNVTVLREVPEAHWLGPELTEILVTPERSLGKYDVARQTIAPQGGPPPHRHAREDEMFYVVDGQFEFVANEEVFAGGPGTSVFLPRGTIHRFKNVGERAGELIIICTPSGFADFVVEASFPCVDRNVPPPAGPELFERVAQACAAYEIELLPAHQAPRRESAVKPPHDLWVLGLHIRILLGTDDTKGAFSLAEIGLHPGDFVPPHLHRTEDEMFYVVAGTVEFALPTGTTVVEKGTLIHVPKGTIHGFRNASDAAAKLMDIHTPGGFEKFFEEAGTPWPDLAVTPAGANADIERFVRICNKHGMDVVGPA
jgi:quercetin dioxygenase-like cupin family protein